MSIPDTKIERFDHFMQRALHDPLTGYYAQNISNIGFAGDFSTTATLSNILGKAIAASALKWSKENNTPLNLIEIGGGDGSLAKSIIKATPFFKRWKLNYHIVDSSKPLIEKQQNKLSQKVSYHKEIKSALNNCKGIAFVFSNELVDAFPVRIFQKTDTGWNELYLKNEEEYFRPLENNIANSSALKHSHNNAQRIEVHESYHHWLKDWLPHLKQGQLLTIDYGDSHPKDITADINFTDLIEWGEQNGLETIALLKQAKYLSPYSKQSPEDEFLTCLQGAGSAFKVLLQQKN